MKKLVLISLTVIALNSCNLANDLYYSSNLGSFELFYLENQQPVQGLIFAEKCEDITRVMVEHGITYQTDRGNYDTDDYWKNPSQTWADKSGDCEDLALLFINLMYTIYDIELDLCMVNVIIDDSIDVYGIVNHATVKLPNGSTYEPLIGNSNFTPKYSYNFNQIFK